MLLQFRFSNVRSFREQQELSLVAGSLKGSPEAVLQAPAVPEGVLPVAAIYGANASGKTNVLRALAFVQQAVSSSYRIWKPDGPIPREAFLADEESQRAPSEFVVDLLLDDTRHQYGISLDSEEVREEWLHVYPKTKRQTWFHRRKGHPISFSSKMAGENRAIENLTRKNSLFLSTAAQSNHEALLPIYQWFANSLFVMIGERLLFSGLTTRFCGKSDYRSSIAKLVSAADLGIADVLLQETKITEEIRKVYEAVITVLKPHPEVSLAAPETASEIRLLHRFGDKTYAFPLNQESNGTIQYLTLLGPVVDAISKGAVLCIDELDASLHPLLAAQLIRLFNSSTNNPKGAQLVFTTQDSNLLSSGLLRRDQIWFTEKKGDGSSQLYPLTDFTPRREENLQNGYLQGRYGAIPFVDPDAFVVQGGGGNGKA